MALIKLLVAPIRRVVNFPLFQLAVAIAVILFLQAAESNSVFGRLFSALDTSSIIASACARRLFR
jgi:hypothetical protein